MYQVEVLVKKIFQDAIVPFRATEGSSFWDVSAEEDITLKRNLVTSVPTGLAFGVPSGYEMEIRPRSGLSIHKIILANSPGSLDSDYRGELKILLLNLGNKDYLIRKGDRIAQIGVKPNPEINFQIVRDLPETDRGSGGFGSTGR